MEKKISGFDFDYMSFDHKLYENPVRDFHDSATHMHHCYELLYFLRGNAVFIIEDKYYRLQEHDCLIVRKNTAHHLKILANEPYERYDVLFEMDECPESILGFFEEVELINCRNNKKVLSCLQDFETFLKLPEKEYRSFAQGLLKQLLYSIWLGYENRDEMSEVYTASIIAKATDYITNNLFTIKSVSEICNHIFVSEGYFFSAFKKHMNITPKKYIVQKRLIAAWDMLKTGKKPSEVAFACGFNSYVNFYRDFVAFFGMKPSECLRSRATRIYMKNNNV